MGDLRGGMLLIPMFLPSSERDWIQYQGRTARQDKRGQMTAVLNIESYAEGLFPPEAVEKVRKVGADDEVWAPNNPREIERLILEHGVKETDQRMEKNQIAFVSGMRANELCELVWAICRHDDNGRPELSLAGPRKRSFLTLVNEFQYMKLDEMTRLASEILPDLKGDSRLSVTSVPREYRESYRPDNRTCKNVVFALDNSGSMIMEASGGKTRLEICKEQVLELFEMSVTDHDTIGLLMFNHEVSWLQQPTLACDAFESLRDGLGGVFADGGTAFHAAIVRGVEAVPGDPNAFVIVLTDGCEGVDKPTAEQVAHTLGDKAFCGVLVLITVGDQWKCQEEAFLSWERALGNDRFVHCEAQDESIHTAFGKVEALISGGGLLDTSGK